MAFSRTGDPSVGEFSDAVVLKAFADVLSDLSALEPSRPRSPNKGYFSRLLNLLPSHPFVAPPITSPFMFAEDDMRVGEPTIVVNDDPRVRRVAVLIRCVPAHVFRTNDPRRSGQGRKD